MLIYWWNCPKKFIPSSLFNWYRLYKLYKTFPGCINISQQKTVFLNAVSIYETYMEEFKSELTKAKRGSK